MSKLTEIANKAAGEYLPGIASLTGAGLAVYNTDLSMLIGLGPILTLAQAASEKEISNTNKIFNYGSAALAVAVLIFAATPETDKQANFDQAFSNYNDAITGPECPPITNSL